MNLNSTDIVDDHEVCGEIASMGDDHDDSVASSDDITAADAEDTNELGNHSP